MRTTAKTRERFAAAFEEWDRRYRENPEAFWSTVRHLTQETPKTYGEACSIFFAKLLSELG